MAKVLIIDDELHILKLLSLKFQLEGFEVLSATTAAEGIELALAQRPDLVILEWRLLNETAITVAERWRDMALSATTPVIVLSARADNSNELNLLPEGMTQIYKPFRPSQLLALARQYV